MEQTPTEAYDELPARTDQQPSIYAERLKARTYSDRDKETGLYIFSDEELDAKGHYWTKRMHEPETSRRGAIEIGHIIDTIALELYARRTAMYNAILPDGVPDTLPEDWQ